MHEVSPDEVFPGGVVPVGLPTDGVAVTIVDEHRRPVPPGVEGEIVVQGAALPLGYWCDAAMTANVFDASPSPGERRYYTGDLGRLREDGRLIHLGRKDRRVKVRGFRIELEEIEAVLGRHPAVARAAVVTRADRHGDATLIAYVELGAEATTADLRAFVAGHLPDHVVPSTFVVVDAMPVSDAGKVVLSELPDPALERSASIDAFEQPVTDTERLIAGVWKDVLGVDVSVNEAFLMAGGDSLRAAQIASRVSEAAGVEVLLWELLDASTISRLAALVDARRAPAVHAAPAPAI
jgi:hypothetical protein